MKKELLPMNLQFFAGEGVNEPEVADPTTEEAVIVENSDPEIDPGNSGNNQEVADPEPTVQTPDENARYAAARRQAEAEQKRIDALYAQKYQGYTNPETGKPILSAMDYMEAVEAQERIAQARELQEKGVDPQMIHNMINSNPVVRQARQVIQAMETREANEKIAEDIREISKMNPRIKTMEDLIRSENSVQVIDFARNHNMRLHEAYRFLNMDSIQNGQANAIRQGAINAARSKSHMIPTNGTTSSGESLVDIPAGELPIWQEAYPDLSVKEITKKYNATLRR